GDREVLAQRPQRHREVRVGDILGVEVLAVGQVADEDHQPDEDRGEGGQRGDVLEQSLGGWVDQLQYDADNQHDEQGTDRGYRHAVARINLGEHLRGKLLARHAVDHAAGAVQVRVDRGQCRGENHDVQQGGGPAD